MAEPLVTVIIPAFNAARWIATTIASACRQTHRSLQIVVVDDGSSDATAEIVGELARADTRVTLIRQSNGGVARARNRALAVAQGAFVAPLDADDVWAPRKIELQLAAMKAAGSGTALVYNWFRRIDADDRVFPGSPSPSLKGRVYLRHLEWNFISNGSTPLVRTEIAKEIGFDPRLRDGGDEGCEDYLFQLRIARRHEFSLVPAFLTGYRRSPSSMGSQAERMVRSHLAMFALLRREANPTACAIIARRIAALQVDLMTHRLRAADPRFVGSLAAALRTEPRMTARAVLRKMGRHKAPLAASTVPVLKFGDYLVTAPDGDWATRRPAEWLAELERKEFEVG